MSPSRERAARAPWDPMFRPEDAPDLSLIIGCYNAARQVERTVLALAEFLDVLGRGWELLIVDDGSSDRTLELLGNLRTQVPRLMILRNPQNMGKGFSIRNGVLNSRGEKIVFTDVDMAFSLSNIRAMIDRLDQGDPVVVANRRLPDSVYTANNRLVRHVYRRHQMGLGFNRLVRLLFGLDTRDTQSGLKGFSREAAMRIFPAIQTHGFLFDVEIFIRARHLGLDVTEIPVHVTYESDDSTVRKFQQFIGLVPTLARIKLHDLRGGYSDRIRGPLPTPLPLRSLDVPVVEELPHDASDRESPFRSSPGR